VGGANKHKIGAGMMKSRSEHFIIGTAMYQIGVDKHKIGTGMMKSWSEHLTF
jgi:hypothetical protein